MAAGSRSDAPAAAFLSRSRAGAPQAYRAAGMGPAQWERDAGLLLTNAVAYDSWPIPSVRMLQRAGAAIERLPTAAL